MKKTIFIILIWVVGFFVGAYICASCNANNKYANKNPTEQTESVATTQQTEPPAQETPSPPICKKSGKVLASFVANGVWYFNFSAYSPCVAAVPFAYLLLDNGDVLIVYPTTPSTHKNVNCTPPFSKEEAQIILEAQLGTQPAIKYQ